MESFPPEPGEAGVVTVVSRSAESGGRVFAWVDVDPERAKALPDLDEIEDEGRLVEAMKELDYHLTMVGGGAGGTDVRRFYFRKG